MTRGVIIPTVCCGQGAYIVIDGWVCLICGKLITIEKCVHGKRLLDECDFCTVEKVKPFDFPIYPEDVDPDY